MSPAVKDKQKTRKAPTNGPRRQTATYENISLRSSHAQRIFKVILVLCLATSIFALYQVQTSNGNNETEQQTPIDATSPDAPPPDVFIYPR